jgi:hypothetical protein
MAILLILFVPPASGREAKPRAHAPATSPSLCLCRKREDGCQWRRLRAGCVDLITCAVPQGLSPAGIENGRDDEVLAVNWPP